MKPYFLALLCLPFVPACNNVSGTRTEEKADSPLSAVPARPRSTEDSAATNLRLAMESTLSPDRDDISIPSFGLKKVMAAIRQLREKEGGRDADGFTIALSDTAYNALTFAEKFTYNLIHGEDYSQMCDALPARPDPEHRIYGQTADFFGEFSWSKRQLNFFRNNRDSVGQLTKAVIDEQGKVGMNLIDAIVEANATDMIPYLIDIDRKDNSNHYILTALLLLMEKNNYPEFTSSVSYTKLYKSDRGTYSAYLVYNKANEDLIIQRATNFYNTREGAPKP